MRPKKNQPNSEFFRVFSLFVPCVLKSWLLYVQLYAGADRSIINNHIQNQFEYLS